jgi:predicted RNA-binding Zn ribbon-like protein
MSAENYRYQFVAGNLALDFINTVAYRFLPEKRKDHLLSTEDVRRWAHQAHLPDRHAINSCPRMSSRTLRRIRGVREQLFAVFRAIAKDELVSDDALRRVGKALHDCQAKQSLSAQGMEVRWTWLPAAACSDFLLYPILTAAIDLLTCGSRSLVRQCADEDCGWLFLDRSNAGKRRWCSMTDCGNRNKAREHYRRRAGSLLKIRRRAELDRTNPQ